VPLAIRFIITLTKVAEKISAPIKIYQFAARSILLDSTLNCGNFKLSIPLNCGYIVIDERKK
jgi:hypothetical protein